LKILVVGDSCKDVFIYGDIIRLAPEAPVPVIKPMYEKENPGMADNVRVNLDNSSRIWRLIKSTNYYKNLK